MTDSLDKLFADVQEARDRSPSASRTSKLFRDGVQKMAKKLVEEAIEGGLDAVQMNRESVILESADVLYHLAVIWAECGVAPADVLGELDRRERIYGIAEKLHKQASAAQGRRLTVLDPSRKSATQRETAPGGAEGIDSARCGAVASLSKEDATSRRPDECFARALRWPG